MSEEVKNVSGCARAQKMVPVEVGTNEVTIGQAAEVATTVIMQKFGNVIGVSREEVQEFHVCSLTAALMKAIDPEVVIDRRVVVPCYFDSMIKGLSTKLGRSVIYPTLAGVVVDVPSSFQRVAMMLKALGIVLVKPHRPANDESATLTLFVEKVDDVDMLTGNSKDVVIDDLVRRALLQVEEKSEALLRELAGELALSYGELDTLLVDYFASACRVVS